MGNVISNKSGLNRKLKVFTVDIQIKRSGSRVSNSKVFGSGFNFEFFKMPFFKDLKKKGEIL